MSGDQYIQRGKTFIFFQAVELAGKLITQIAHRVSNQLNLGCNLNQIVPSPETMRLLPLGRLITLIFIAHSFWLGSVFLGYLKG